MTKQELLAIVETLKEFKGMLWGQTTTVYTDHKNLMQDALGLTSDRVYCWRLLLEDYSPTIEYIKGIHNTVVDAISRLDHGPVSNDRYNWMTFTQCWCHYTKTAKETGASQANYRIHEPCVCQSQQRKLHLSSYNQRDSGIAVKRHTTSSIDHTGWLFNQAS